MGKKKAAEAPRPRRPDFFEQGQRWRGPGGGLYKVTDVRAGLVAYLVPEAGGNPEAWHPDAVSFRALGYTLIEAS